MGADLFDVFQVSFSAFLGKLGHLLVSFVIVFL